MQVDLFPPLTAEDASLEQLLEERIEGVLLWLDQNEPISTQQEAEVLDSDAREQLYWGHGYLYALRDIQEFIQRRRSSMN